MRVDSHYCAVHADQEKEFSKWPIALGVAEGHAVAPGLGGWLVGGLIGSAFVDEKKMNKTRVFVSFEKVILVWARGGHRPMGTGF